tara:strand:- start:713 stop:1642 length:930 start_codon:yes stop_codon:yes gene_type:complete
MTRGDNTRLADVNEIWCAYLLNGDQFPDRITEQTFNRKKTALSDQEYKDQIGRAEAMVKEFTKMAERKGYGTIIDSVYWTAKPGFDFLPIVGVKVNQTKFPADILVQYAMGGFLGLSAKSTISGDVGFKNPGVGTVDADLGLNLAGYIAAAEEEALEDYPDFARMTKANRTLQMRRWKESGDERYKILNEKGSDVETYCRDQLFAKLNNIVSQQERRQYLISSWLDATNAYPPYLKITGSGEKGRYNAVGMDPLANSKMDAINTKRITFVKAGKNSITVNAGSTPLFNIRYKFKSYKFSGAMKLSGDPR